MRLLLIDNYDSFTYNLYQLLLLKGKNEFEVLVYRNDRISLSEAQELSPAGIVISPGPGGPHDGGINIDLVRHFLGATPLLGVCLGHQIFAHFFGGRVVRASTACHGKCSMVYHDDSVLFKGVPSPFRVARYHSLCVDPYSFPTDLLVTAQTEDKVIMGFQHLRYPLWGLQFHPESFLTEAGDVVAENFLKMCRHAEK